MNKILVIQLKFLGDVLVATNIVDNLKNIDDNLIVDFLCYQNAFPLVENHPNINKIWAIDEKETKNIADLFGLILSIRKEKYDVIIDPYSKLQTMLISLFSGANTRVSYDKGFLRKLIYNKRISENNMLEYSGVKAIDDRISLVKVLFPDNKKWLSDYRLYVDKSLFDTDELENCGANGNFLIFGVLGSSIEKSYPIPYMIEVLNLVRKNYKGNIIFNYAPNQKNIALDIYYKMESKENVFPFLIGKNLKEFIQTLSSAEMCITNEGGLSHMAKALDIPTFSIFSIPATKKSWNTMSDKTKHVAVHLFDYKTNLPHSILDLEPKKFREILFQFLFKSINT